MEIRTLSSIPLRLTLFAALCFGCDVEAKGDRTGGLGGAIENASGGSTGLGGTQAGGAGGASESPEIACPRGIAVVLSDYASTQIALSNLDGVTLSESVLSTASTTSDGLAFPLSGDVALPSGPFAELVVLDRYGTNVMSWVDLKSGQVRGQLPVGTGFESNPQDYLELDSEISVISRWGQNGAPGGEDYDDGGDLLFINRKELKIVGQLILPAPGDLPARPSSLSRVGEELFVTLDRIALDFSETGEAILVPVDLKTRKAGTPLVLEGLKACGELVPVPDTNEVVLACTGALGPTGEVESLSESALVFFDKDARPLRETRRILAKDIVNEPLQNQFAFASATKILLKTQTTWGGEKNNRLLSFDLVEKKATELLEALPDNDGKGQGLTLGTILCQPGCSDFCVVSDASRKNLARVNIKQAAPKLADPIVVETKVGLPPRSLGLY